jgi:hypothetical protein
MSKEEIRKLLGGYSTNTLTESERSALFEAALDDQELFNALQQEQALKSLLDDPATRVQVRQALERQPSGRQTGLRMRWWAWGGAASAAAAATILLVVFRPNPLRPAKKPVEIASLEKAPSPAVPEQPNEQKRTVVAPKERPRMRAKAADEPAPDRDTLPAAPAAAPPPLIPAPVQPRAVGSLRPQEPGALMAGRAQDQVALASAPVAKTVSGSLEPLLRYSLLKLESNEKKFAPASDAELKPGDFVRLQVSAALAGQLTLSRLDDAGQWQRMADISALANSRYTIPDSPIEVTATTQRYRLTLETSPPQAGIVGAIAGGPKREMRAASAAQATIAAPAVVEITIGGKAGN